MVMAKVVYMEVEMVDKGSKRRRLSWWLLCWRLQEARKKEKRNERERRRGGIYRSWIVKVMQINKGEGFFVKLGVRYLSWPLGRL